MFGDRIKYKYRLCWWFIIDVNDRQQSSPPPPPTYTLESSKTLNHAKIIQTNRDRAANGKKELDVKYENKQVSELKGSFMLATKSDIVEISDGVLNLSTTHAIIEQHLVNTKSELPLSQNNYSNNASDKEELCDNVLLYLCHN